MAAWRESKQSPRHSFRMTWIEPFALLAVVFAALTVLVLLSGGGR